MFKLTCKGSLCALTAMLSASALLTGCVDDDYDLSKDIDKNVTVGGNTLYLPACSTGEITMSRVLDLKDESSIRAIKATDTEKYGLQVGDYILLEDGDRSETYVKVEQVRLKDIQIESDGIDVPFVPFGDLTLPANFTSNLTISDNSVDTELKRLDHATTDLDLDMYVGYSSAEFRGGLKIDKGYTITFDKKWEVAITDPATAAIAKIVDGHKLVFTSDKKLSNNTPFHMIVKVKGFNLGTKQGEGLYAPGHFDLKSDVDFAGNVTAVDDSHEFVLGNVHVDFNLKIKHATLLSVTGIVDPKVTINSTNVSIGDIPDFLDDPDNHLDVANPQIYFTITNTSPVSVTVKAMIEGLYKDKSPVEIYIGKWDEASIHGTDEILVGPGTTRVCLSRTGEGYTPSEAAHYDRVLNIKVSNISDLLASIPTNIEVKKITANVVQEPVTFVLAAPDDNGYLFRTDYEAVVPLAFGDKLNIEYDDKDNGWDEDLKGYSFGALNVEMDVVNTIPLSLVPDAELLGVNDMDFADVTIDVDGQITAGALTAPSTSHIKLTARCKDGADLNGVKGIRYWFRATNEAATNGVILNENQGLKLENIKVYLTGGVTVNLDDIDDDDNE